MAAMVQLVLVTGLHVCASAAAGGPSGPIACSGAEGNDLVRLGSCATAWSDGDGGGEGDAAAMLALPRARAVKNFTAKTSASPHAPWQEAIDALPVVDEGAQGSHWNPRPVPKGTPVGSSSQADRLPSSDFDIDPANFRKYKSGQHRRPTDPPSKAEILMVQRFLFGPEPVSSLEGADELFAQEPWQHLRSALASAGVGGIHPATISGVLGPEVECPKLLGSTYEDLVDQFGVDKAFQKLLQCPPLRCHSSNLWSAWEIGVEVPDRQHILDVEAAIESGEEGYDMRRILSVRLKGGYTSKTHKLDGDSTKWGSELFIAVDSADPAALRVVPEYLDVYEVALDYGIKPPPKMPLDDTSAAYLQTAMSAMYLEYETMGTTMGLPTNYLPKYNGRSADFEGTPVTYIMKFAKPFLHKRGTDAYTYGYGAKEWVMSAELTNARYESIPIDGHAVSSGAIIGQMPLTFQYAINREGGYVNPEQTLPSFEGGSASSAAMTWYGRGLTFNKTGGLNLLAASAAHMGISVEGTPLERLRKERNAAMYAEVVEILASAISDAWGQDEAIPGTGFRPGTLTRARKHGRDVSMPSDAVKHSFDVPSFVNHATPPAFHSAGNPYLALGRTRDVRDNPDYMAPPLDAEGQPQYAANGPPPAGKHGSSGRAAYSIDGYAVTYDVGMKWKMLLSFDRSAGLTFWNVRLRLPPSAASPNGTEYPLLFRANVPNFGTDYASSSLGNVQAYNFLESHYSAATAHRKGVSCKGETLPVFMHLGGGGPYFANKFGAWYASYSTLGVPGFVDPIFGLPLEGFPTFETGAARDAIIEEGICIEEHIAGVNNWHMYALQTERCLRVGQSTISDAYNVVVKGEFCNTGHLFVGQDLQGKPAPGGPAGIDGVGGAYSSRGNGGFAPNHLHWAVVALEGFVGSGENILQVVDSEQDGDSDVYGLGFNFLTERVRSAQDRERLSYSYPLGRAYRFAGVDGRDRELGGLKLESHCWGSKIKKAWQSHAAGIPLERSYYGNHWWLRDQDVFVLPVDQELRTRDTMDLLSHGRVGQHYDFYRSTAHPKAHIKDFGKSFTMFSVLKMRHNVQTEELPIQAAFKQHGINMKPHFLAGFNMDILMRYDPSWNKFFQTNFVGTGGDEYVEQLPYSSEYADP